MVCTGISCTVYAYQLQGQASSVGHDNVAAAAAAAQQGVVLL